MFVQGFSKLRQWCLAAVLTAVSCSVMAADPAAPVVRFFSSFNGLKADIVQSVYDQRHQLQQELHGSVAIQRPGKFRWSYQTPYVQQIVADGRKLWFYDVDLEQVTVKSQDQTLGSTPAALLSSSSALTEQFTVESNGQRDGLNWFKLTPKKQNANVERIALVFKGETFKRLEVIDSFGQLTVFNFENLQLNPKLDPQLFKFTAPKGVDVIDETATR